MDMDPASHAAWLGEPGRIFDIDQVQGLAAALSSAEYAQAHMQGAPRFADKDALLRHAAGLAPAEGLVLEFGVFAGRSINLLAECLPGRPIHGFDSFEGLPEGWRPGFGPGAFALPAPPEVPPGVELVVGWFDRTLPGFLDDHPGPAALLHVDCDLYSSTQTVLAQLRDRIGAGTILVFDEYFNYPGWQQHEHRAFREFAAGGRAYEYVGLVPSDQQVAVRMLR
ncbi:class I SAM-dependent methyltransferase [Roseomonas frigidaquae]|uniref:Class I SAM-dependent methyltransferase n=1 Tax=Falsiroseomonas frigidaquae TaxID=487318 RepID=A0ABX1F8J4_9PROT|nr:class I SAM-dependent methyltransferase [Falsiroseomonas frigidaquae]NKE48710.1 class I SAM-dependent methyltransferase [Falsiroseomonas frigidaquae]